MDIGSKIQKVRELRGFSQEYVGSQLGVSQQYYSRMESGQMDLDEDTLTKIATILEVDKEKLRSFDTNLVFNNNNQQGGNFNAAQTINNAVPEVLLEHLMKMKEGLDELVSALKKRKKT